MNKDLLVIRIKSLCEKKGVNMTRAFKESCVGKNFISNLSTSEPSKKNLSLLAEYFDCSIEYLIGEETEEEYASKVMGRVMEWLENNDYTVSEDEHSTLTIEKDGKACYYANADFVTESLAIKAMAQDGFELAMLDWERRNFLSISNNLSPQETAIVNLLRETTEEGRLEMIAALVQIKKEIEKKSEGTNKVSVG